MSSERTEAPTPKRKHEARAEGRVARSPEVNAALALLIGTWLVGAVGGRMLTDLQAILVTAASIPPPGDINPNWLSNLMVGDFLQVAPSLGVILAGLLVAGVSISVAQTGLLVAYKRIKFDFGRVNPLAGLKRLISLQGLVELVKAVLKLGIVVWVAYNFLRSRAGDLVGLSQMDLFAALSSWSALAGSLAIRTGTVYLMLALADYGYQRWQHTRSLRMTKEEVKEEHKQQEGDPRIRARIKGQMRRLARMRMMAKVPAADVVITNPTHLAIAVQYQADEMTAPKVLAKGAYHMAERIVSTARAHNIPVVQNIPLARALYRGVEVDQEIPPAFYKAMAEILAYVYRLQGTGAQG